MRYGRRFTTVDELHAEITAWHDQSNTQQHDVDWQFKVDDARGKLKSVYLKLEV